LRAVGANLFLTKSAVRSLEKLKATAAGSFDLRQAWTAKMIKFHIAFGLFHGPKPKKRRPGFSA
jgi:hypothetical protein